jgi:putative ABC transport system substrate-binding protein
VRRIGLLMGVADDREGQARVTVLKQGLQELGWAEGRNIQIETRFGGADTGRIRAHAAELVALAPDVIVGQTTPVKAATTTIPIVFEIGTDPVKLGLITSLNRPGGNVTGVTNLSLEVTPKRLELLHELLPTVRVMALLVNPAEPVNAETTIRDLEATAHGLGLELHVLNASTERDFDAVFAKLIQLRAGGLVIGASPFLVARQEQLAALAVRHAVPAVFEYREFVAAGGLMSYGGAINEAYRLAGVYAARVLKGDKPANLPVQQVTKVEFYINLKSAKALGITVPLPLSGRADEVLHCVRSLLAQSGVSLRCQCLTAVGGEADIARVSRSCRSDREVPARLAIPERR